MDYKLERKYFQERSPTSCVLSRTRSPICIFPDEQRVYFRCGGRPFEVIAWIDKDYDLICVTTKSADTRTAKVKTPSRILEATMRVCWEHCVSFYPVETRYELSMALFVGGCTFEAFEGCVYTLMGCAEAIEEQFRKAGGLTCATT